MVREIRSRKLSERIKELSNSFKLFGFMGVMTLVIGVTLYLVTQQQDLRQRASENINLPNAGMNLQVHFDTSYISDPNPLNFDTFKAQIDELKAAAGSRSLLIRFPIWDWEGFPFNNPDNLTIDCRASTPINCNPQRLDQYGEAIDYVRSKGFQVQLVTNVPQWAKLYSKASGTGEKQLTREQYLALTDAYYREIGSRYSGKVRIWLVIGEADVQAFDKFADNTIKDSPLTTEYLSQLNAVYAQARTTIKNVDPNGLITTTSGGWPYNSALRDRWNTYFDSVGTHFDIISVDIYPDSNVSEIQQISTNISQLKARYGKPVIMAETGLCTSGTGWTATDQATYIPQTLAQARDGGADSMLLFMYQDNAALTDPTYNCAPTFGIKDKTGAQKSSYPKIMDCLLNGLCLENSGLLRVETNPSAGIEINVTSLKTNQSVSTTTWSVDWKNLPSGNYKISYSNPSGFKLSNGSLPKLPNDSYLTIFSNQTTTVLTDMNNGTQTINPTPVVSTPTPTPTPTPTNTPTPIPNTPTSTPQTTGLLRVETSPATAATIKILKTNGRVVMSNTWSIDWKPLAAGTYYIQFSYPKTAGLITPKTTLFRHYSSKVTEIIGNFTTGRTSTKYY